MRSHRLCVADPGRSQQSAALGDRHIEDAGENGTIVIFGDGAGKSAESRLSLAMGYFLQSAAMMHHAFRTGGTSVARLLQEFDRTRSPLAPPAVHK
jgi:hypothetical protein